MDAEPEIIGETTAVGGDGEPVATEPVLQTLSDYALELRYFTTALIYTHGHFDRDVLYEFNSRYYVDDPDLRPFAVDCARPFFQGLGVTPLGRTGEQVNWDHRIYAIHQSRWEQCLQFLLGISFSNPATQHYVRVFSHVLQLLDPTAWDRVTAVDEVPEIMLTVFGVSTNRNFVYLQPAANPPLTRPCPVAEAPRQDAIREGQAVLNPTGQ